MPAICDLTPSIAAHQSPIPSPTIPPPSSVQQIDVITVSSITSLAPPVTARQSHSPSPALTPRSSAPQNDAATHPSSSPPTFSTTVLSSGVIEGQKVAVSPGGLVIVACCGYLHLFSKMLPCVDSLSAGGSDTLTLYNLETNQQQKWEMPTSVSHSFTIKIMDFDWLQASKILVLDNNGYLWKLATSPDFQLLHRQLVHEST
jgi:hypothetical protein